MMTSRIWCKGTVNLSHCVDIALCGCHTVKLSHCVISLCDCHTVWISHCKAVTLCCNNVWLPHCMDFAL
jgi:hypothetical protein